MLVPNGSEIASYHQTKKGPEDFSEVGGHSHIESSTSQQTVCGLCQIERCEWMGGRPSL